MKQDDIGEHPREPSYETLRAQVEYWREAALAAEHNLQYAFSGIDDLNDEIDYLQTRIEGLWSSLQTALVRNKELEQNK